MHRATVSRFRIGQAISFCGIIRCQSEFGQCTASFGTPVVPELCVISAGSRGSGRTGRRRGAGTVPASATAPARCAPDGKRTALVSPVSSTPDSVPSSLPASVTNHGLPRRPSISATTAPSSAGDSMAGTAPVHEIAQASRAMSKLCVL
jgi:hypothetical protein